MGKKKVVFINTGKQNLVHEKKNYKKIFTKTNTRNIYSAAIIQLRHMITSKLKFHL